MENMELWNKVSKPPLTALKPIGAGRLKGKSDINPQWRYQIMTELFGPCGIGWKYTIDRQWTELGSDHQVMCFANVSVYVKYEGAWSEAIPGVGGSMLVEQESKGLHTSDEGYKMAVTDALSVAMKMIGVAAEIYLGNYDGSKYKTGNPPPPDAKKDPPPDGKLSAVQESLLKELGEACKGDEGEMSILLSEVTKTEKDGEWKWLKLEQVRNVQYHTEAWGKTFGAALGKLRAHIKAQSQPSPFVEKIEAALTVLCGDDAAAKETLVEATLGKKEWRSLDDSNLQSLAFILEARAKDKQP